MSMNRPSVAVALRGVYGVGVCSLLADSGIEVVSLDVLREDLDAVARPVIIDSVDFDVLRTTTAIDSHLTAIACSTATATMRVFSPDQPPYDTAMNASELIAAVLSSPIHRSSTHKGVGTYGHLPSTGCLRRGDRRRRQAIVCRRDRRRSIRWFH